MTNRESTWVPTYPTDLHPDVIGECRDTWMKLRPYTMVRVLRKDVDTSEMPCCGASGAPGPCSKKVEAVQYNTAFGDPLFYCEEHAIIQQEWDVVHYDSKSTPRRPKWTAEDQARVDKSLEKRKKRNNPDPENEDLS